MSTSDKRTFRRCLKCGAETNEARFFSEDFSTPIEIDCKCGHRGRWYVGSNDGKAAWQLTMAELDAAWPIVITVRS